MMLIALLLEGCATPPSVPENLKYKEPAGSVEAGSVLGSQVGRLLEDDETAFVIGVDGLQVIIGRDGWNKPLRIAAGARQIAVAFIKGGYRCYAVMPLDVSSDATYRVRHTTDMGFFGGTYCDFWIENEESKKPCWPDRPSQDDAWRRWLRSNLYSQKVVLPVSVDRQAKESVGTDTCQPRGAQPGLRLTVRGAFGKCRSTPALTARFRKAYSGCACSRFRVVCAKNVGYRGRGTSDRSSSIAVA